MKKSSVLLGVLAATVLSATASVKIATVDMEVIIKSHPQAAENTNRLVEMQKEFEGQRDALADKIKGLHADFKKVYGEAQSEALSEMARKQKQNEARDLGQTIQQEELALRKMVNDLQGKLQEKELLLFENVMSDVKYAINVLVKNGAYDLIVDKSAMRFNAPIPIVMYASDSLDITDAVIKEIGGKRVEMK